MTERKIVERLENGKWTEILFKHLRVDDLFRLEGGVTLRAMSVPYGKEGYGVIEAKEA